MEAIPATDLQQNPVLNINEGNRYQKIIIGIAIFILLMAAGVIATFIISSDIKQISSEINLAGRQRMLSQRTAKLVNVIEVSSRRSDQEGIEIAQQELQLTHKLFDKTLNAFALGGETLDADAKTVVTLSRVNDNVLRENIDQALEIWKGFGPRVKALSVVDPAKLTDKQLQNITSLSAEYNLVLLKLMNNLTQGLEVAANKKANNLNAIQAGALVLVLINFAWVVVSAFGSLRRRDDQLNDYAKLLQSNNKNLEATNRELAQSKNELNSSNTDLNKAYESLKLFSDEAQTRADELEILSGDLNLLKEESDTIFNSVDHGLCLIDKNFEIGKRVSAATYGIFETETLVGRSLVDLMRPLITEKDSRTLDSFLKLQFNPKTSDKQLEKYNPLKKIEVTLNWDGQGFTNKHLGFNFERVMNEGVIDSVLVTITDVTETVVLENQLKQANENQEKNTSLIMEIIHADRKELNIFLSQTDKELDAINDLLRDQGVSEGGDGHVEGGGNLTELIFRKVHNIKGNASMLKLVNIVNTAQTIETKLSELRQKNQVTGDQFLSAIVELAYLRELLTSYDELAVLLTSNTDLGPARNDGKKVSKSQKVINELEAFTAQLSDDMNKEVFMNASLPIEELDDEMLTANKDIIIQLIRNSIAHGIEDSEERRALGKWDYGTLSIDYRLDISMNNPLNQPCHVFKYRDDGKGLDKEAIKYAAIEKGLLVNEHATQMSESEIIAHIFEPGFTTAKAASEHAGRGVGMDIIKDHVVNRLNGKLRMGYVKGKSLEFTWYIPLEASKETAA